jgi:hypothetical protein
MLDPSRRNLGAGRPFGKRPFAPRFVRKQKARTFPPGLRAHYLDALSQEASGRFVEGGANASLDRFGCFRRDLLRVLGEFLRLCDQGVELLA